MVAFNKIRIDFEDEQKKLKPLLRNAYQSIYGYQLQRTTENETHMREAIADTASILNLFVEHIPFSKSKYITALHRQDEMTPFDVIMCFDQAVFELHLWATLDELGIKRGTWAKGRRPWSKELRALLDERQRIEPDETKMIKEERFLASGNPACRGTATGPAYIVVGKDDFSKLKSGSILVTAMTTPDFIEVVHLISALVTDRGGIMCHAAILAREFNIPCIVGCHNATHSIQDGEQIRVDAISGVVLGV